MANEPLDVYKNTKQDSRPAWRTTLLIGAVLLIVGVVAMSIESSIGEGATYSGLAIIAVSFAAMIYALIQYLRRKR